MIYISVITEDGEEAYLFYGIVAIHRFGQRKNCIEFTSSTQCPMPDAQYPNQKLVFHLQVDAREVRIFLTFLKRDRDLVVLH